MARTKRNVASKRSTRLDDKKRAKVAEVEAESADNDDSLTQPGNNLLKSLDAALDQQQQLGLSLNLFEKRTLTVLLEKIQINNEITLAKRSLEEVKKREIEASENLQALKQKKRAICEQVLNYLKLSYDNTFSMAFSPDGKVLASGDKTVKLWNTEDGSLIRTLEGHDGYVWSVAFSPDGKLLASGSQDKRVKLWNTEDGSLIRTLEGHVAPVLSVAFSPDGKVLASGSENKRVKLWNTEDGSLIRTLEGHASSVNSVAFSPDGKVLASGSGDETVKLWNTEDGSLIRTLKGHAHWVTSVTFSPDGKVLVSGSADKTVKLWNTEDHSLIRTLEGHPSRFPWSGNAVWSVAFSPDAKLLTGNDNGLFIYKI